MTTLLRLIPLCAMALLAVISIAVMFRRLSSAANTSNRGWESAPTWLQQLRSRDYLLAYAMIWLLGTTIGILVVLTIAFATVRGVSFNFFAYVIGGVLGLALLKIAWALYRRLAAH